MRSFPINIDYGCCHNHVFFASNKFLIADISYNFEELITHNFPEFRCVEQDDACSYKITLSNDEIEVNLHISK